MFYLKESNNAEFKKKMLTMIQTPSQPRGTFYNPQPITLGHVDTYQCL